MRFARIFGVDINLEAVEETRGIIEREEGQCEIYEADVSDSDQVRAWLYMRSHNI